MLVHSTCRQDNIPSLLDLPLPSATSSNTVPNCAVSALRVIQTGGHDNRYQQCGMSSAPATAQTYTVAEVQKSADVPKVSQPVDTVQDEKSADVPKISQPVDAVQDEKLIGGVSMESQPVDTVQGQKSLGVSEKSPTCRYSARSEISRCVREISTCRYSAG